MSESTREPYIVVEYGEESCPNCGSGKIWDVIGPDDVAISVSFHNRDDADEIAEWMSSAYKAGKASGHNELVAALREITERYVDLVNSGDCGFWEPEDEKPVKAARAALAKAEVKDS